MGNSAGGVLLVVRAPMHEQEAFEVASSEESVMDRAFGQQAAERS